MGIKKSVYLTDLTIDFIKKRQKDKGDDKVSWSTGINHASVVADLLLKDNYPDLSNEEWEIILNTYTGCIVDFHPPARIASDIMDSHGEVKLDNLPDEISSLIVKTHNMSQSEQIAILDFVQQYWSNDWNKYRDFNEVKDKILNG